MTYFYFYDRFDIFVNPMQILNMKHERLRLKFRIEMKGLFYFKSSEVCFKQLLDRFGRDLQILSLDKQLITVLSTKTDFTFSNYIHHLEILFIKLQWSYMY